MPNWISDLVFIFNPPNTLDPERHQSAYHKYLDGPANQRVRAKKSRQTRDYKQYQNKPQHFSSGPSTYIRLAMARRFSAELDNRLRLIVLFSFSTNSYSRSTLD
jgi:hypothetical protein